MEANEAWKLILAAFIGALVPRFFKNQDKNQDLVVRQAVSDEKSSALQDRVAILERNEKALWKEIDKLKSFFTKGQLK